MHAPLILVTNDDGIESPGLAAAVAAVSGLGKVVVAAPTTQQTARGRSMVGNRDDWFHPVSDPDFPCDLAYHIDASPALVVRHAFAVLFGGVLPDLVVSGINYGENLGNNIMISGTLGAAFQAAAAGIPALAVSLQTDVEHHYSYHDLHFDDAARVTRTYTKKMVGLRGSAGGRVLPFDVIKLDVPQECPPGTEERLTHLSRHHYFTSHYESPHPETRIREAETRIDAPPDRLERGDDIHAVSVDGVVSVTPLTLDCTAPLPASRGALGL